MGVVPIGSGAGGILTASAYAYVQYSGADYPTPQTVPTSQMQNANAPDGGPLSLALAAGLNTIPVPAGAAGFVLELPSSNTVGVTVQLGKSADAGTNMAPNGWMAFPFDQAHLPTDIYVTAASAIAGAKLLWF